MIASGPRVVRLRRLILGYGLEPLRGNDGSPAGRQLVKQPEERRGQRHGCCDDDDDNEYNLLGEGDNPASFAHWSYSGATGPDHWGDLDPRFAAAKTGRQQSPIDLAEPFQPGVETVFFTYQAAALSVTNNGHSIQVDCPAGSSISLGGRRYELLQFHFHTPSEHTVDGGFYEMELHLVHQNDQGQLAVVGVFLATGDAHSTLREIWEHMPTQVGQTVSNDLMIDPSDFLPTDRRSVHYEGSLTTPPCTEGVARIMMLEPIYASSDQMEQFEQVIGPNSRPVQPRNDRKLRAGR